MEYIFLVIQEAIWISTVVEGNFMLGQVQEREKTSLKFVTLSTQHLNLKASLLVDTVVSISGSIPEGEVKWFSTSALL